MASILESLSCPHTFKRFFEGKASPVCQPCPKPPALILSMIIFTKLKTNTTYELYLKSEFVTICPSSTMTMIINSDIFYLLKMVKDIYFFILHKFIESLNLQSGFKLSLCAPM